MYQQPKGDIHLVHKGKVLVVDIWDLRANEAKKKEAAVVQAVSAGSAAYPAKYSAPPAKAPPAPGLETQVNRVFAVSPSLCGRF